MLVVRNFLMYIMDIMEYGGSHCPSHPSWSFREAHAIRAWMCEQAFPYSSHWPGIASFPSVLGPHKICINYCAILHNCLALDPLIRPISTTITLRYVTLHELSLRSTHPWKMDSTIKTYFNGIYSTHKITAIFNLAFIKFHSIIYEHCRLCIIDNWF